VVQDWIQSNDKESSLSNIEYCNGQSYSSFMQSSSELNMSLSLLQEAHDKNSQHYCKNGTSIEEEDDEEEEEEEEVVQDWIQSNDKESSLSNIEYIYGKSYSSFMQSSELNMSSSAFQEAHGKNSHHHCKLKNSIEEDEEEEEVVQKICQRTSLPPKLRDKI